MSHILSHEKDFAFIHIPKNGGSTIRNQFHRFDDCGGKFFFRDAEHPKWGKIAFGHLPLWVIEEEYPNDYAALRQVESFAMTRDPEVRFRSAMAQRARQHLGRPLHELSPDERRDDADAIMRHLDERPQLPLAEFAHFTRQIDFIDHGGARVVKRLYPLDRLDDLVAALGKKVGIKPAAVRGNATEETRFGPLGRLARAGWSAVRPLLPMSLQNAARRQLRGAVVASGTKRDKLGLMDDRLLKFLRDFYRADYELHATALAAFAPAVPSHNIAQSA